MQASAVKHNVSTSLSHVDNFNEEPEQDSDNKKNEQNKDDDRKENEKNELLNDLMEELRMPVADAVREEEDPNLMVGGSKERERDFKEEFFRLRSDQEDTDADDKDDRLVEEHERHRKVGHQHRFQPFGFVHMSQEQDVQVPADRTQMAPDGTSLEEEEEGIAEGGRKEEFVEQFVDKDRKKGDSKDESVEEDAVSQKKSDNNKDDNEEKEGGGFLQNLAHRFVEMAFGSKVYDDGKDREDDEDEDVAGVAIKGRREEKEEEEEEEESEEEEIDNQTTFQEEGLRTGIDTTVTVSAGEELVTTELEEDSVEELKIDLDEDEPGKPRSENPTTTDREPRSLPVVSNKFSTDANIIERFGMQEETMITMKHPFTKLKAEEEKKMEPLKIDIEMGLGDSQMGSTLPVQCD